MNSCPFDEWPRETREREHVSLVEIPSKNEIQKSAELSTVCAFIQRTETDR